jgi:hypothetical protein
MRAIAMWCWRDLGRKFLGARALEPSLPVCSGILLFCLSSGAAVCIDTYPSSAWFHRRWSPRKHLASPNAVNSMGDGADAKAPSALSRNNEAPSRPEPRDNPTACSVAVTEKVIEMIPAR